MPRVQSLRVGTAAQMLPLFAGYSFNLLATPYVVATIGLREFGFWAITGALAQYGALFDLGVSRSVTRFVALYHAREDRANERAVIGGCLGILIALGAILIAIPLLIPGVLHRIVKTDSVSTTQTLVLASVLILVFGMLGRILAAASFGRGRMVAGNIGLAIQTAGVVFGGVIALVITPTLTSFAIGSAAGSLFGFFAVIVCLLVDEGKIPLGLPKLSVMPDLISFGLKGQSLAVADIVMFQSGKLIAGVVIGPAAAGAYELGSRLALGARAFGAAASVTLTTHLTRKFAVDGEAEIRAEYARLTQRNAAVGIFGPFLLVAVSYSAVPMWLGSENGKVLAVIIALSLAFSLNVSTGVATATVLALNRPEILVVAATVATVVTIGLSVPMAYAFGFAGVLIASAIAIVIGAIIGVRLLHKRVDIPIAQYVRPIAGPYAVAFASLAAAMPVGIVMMPHDRASAIVPLVLSAVIFVAAYLALGWKYRFLPSIRR